MKEQSRPIELRHPCPSPHEATDAPPFFQRVRPAADVSRRDVTAAGEEEKRGA